MLKPIKNYVSHEVLPRKCRIILSYHFWVALLVIILYPLIGTRIELKASEVSGAILAYSSIAVGFCLTSFILALTLPNTQFVNKIAQSEIKENGEIQNAYADLLFVFSWTAIVHWVLIFYFVLILFLWPRETALYSYNYHWIKKGFVLLAVGQAVYAIFQFLITLITLSQVGRVYLHHLKSTPTI